MKLVVAGLQNDARADAIVSRLICTEISKKLETRRCRTSNDLSALEKNDTPKATALF